MDRHSRDLTNQLCTQAGMIMEDISVLALAVGGLSDEELGERIAVINVSAERIDALAKAARVLLVKRE